MHRCRRVVIFLVSSRAPATCSLSSPLFRPLRAARQPCAAFAFMSRRSKPAEVEAAMRTGHSLRLEQRQRDRGCRCCAHVAPQKLAAPRRLPHGEHAWGTLYDDNATVGGCLVASMCRARARCNGDAVGGSTMASSWHYARGLLLRACQLFNKCLLRCITPKTVVFANNS